MSAGELSGSCIDVYTGVLQQFRSMCTDTGYWTWPMSGIAGSPVM